MKTQIIRENGYYWSEGGSQYLWKDNAAAHRRAVYRGEVKPTIRYQCRRFRHLLRGRLREIVKDAIAYLDAVQHGGETSGGEIVYDLDEGRVVYSPARSR